ncbi:hypothetical protein Ahy_B05g075044 isoform A [Arachis hypogaea]|uniref:Uncharacterized protein n=1 Tax=Arachis hypogaea TaxID=3818 RepID=A0A444Z0E5_ARAHY|nr:hypothetical protein Ahy_B05g075044 isoform A [Arachis hypogaea]
MDQITFNGQWYREPLGSFQTGPPYIQHWNKDIMRLYKIFEDLNDEVYENFMRNLPGFDKIAEKVTSKNISFAQFMMKITMRRQILGGEGNQTANLVSSRIVRSTREVLRPSMSRMLLIRSLQPAWGIRSSSAMEQSLGCLFPKLSIMEEARKRLAVQQQTAA